MVCLCSCMKNSVFYPSSSILRRPPPRVCFLFLLYPGPSSLSEYFHICLQKFFAMIDLEILKKQGFVNQSDTPWICWMTRVGIEVEGQTRSVLTTRVILILRTRSDNTFRVNHPCHRISSASFQLNHHGLGSVRHGPCYLRFPHTEW